MTWTYDAGQITTVPLMQARYLVQDTMAGDQQLQDEEITFTLSRYSNTYSACAELCRTLSLKFARQVDIVQGELKTNYSQRSRRYSQLAADFEQRGLRGAMPYAGAMSNTDKNSVAQDSDRPPPDFNRGQFDDYLPVGPAGEQTPSAPLPDTDQFP